MSGENLGCNLNMTRPNTIFVVDVASAFHLLTWFCFTVPVFSKYYVISGDVKKIKRDNLLKKFHLLNLQYLQNFTVHIVNVKKLGY